MDIQPNFIDEIKPTAFSVDWLCPLEYPPPLGVNLLLLTKQGVLVKGRWEEAHGNIAWAPMPKIPPFIKERVGKRRDEWENL